MSVLIGHADHVDQQQLGQPVLAHHGNRVRPAGLGQVQVTVVLDREQPVPLHPGDRLADRWPALVQSLGDPGAQRRDPLLFELEDGLQIHLGGVD
jgi:hypothetical protein